MSARRLFVRLGIGAAGLVVVSAIASAHELGHGGIGYGAGAVAFVVLLGLPTLAGLAGGVVAVRYRHSRRPKLSDRGCYSALGLLLVGLGAVSFLPAVSGHHMLSVAGGTTGAALALWVASGRSGMAPGTGCGNHAELTLGAISIHRLLEGAVVGTLYAAGAAVGLLAAVVLAAHTALETAAVAGLYATTSRRTWALWAIVFVQTGYVVGAVVGLGVVGAVPVPVRAFVLAVVGGALLVVGAGVTERSVAAGSPVVGD